MRPPNTDRQMSQITVGEVVPHDATIELSEYQTAWPKLFGREAARITGALGDRALRVEHVGSTSVPGLVAKPKIDIVLAVASSAQEAAYRPQLEHAGYVLCIREPAWFEHRVFKGPDTDVNLHVFTQGCSEVDRMIAFRDHLRQNAEDRGKYAEVKRDLAKRQWRYMQDYADAKDTIVAEISSRVCS